MLETLDPYTRKSVEDELHILATCPSGGRNHQLNKSAFAIGQFVEAGFLGDYEARQQLYAAASQCGLVKDDGEHSVNATIDSGFKAAAQKPRTKFGDDETPGVLNLDDIPAFRDLNRQFWESREALAHIQQFAYSRMTAPWAVLGGCLLRSVSQIPTTTVLPPIIGGRGSVNLLVALVGASGTGKGASEAAAREAFAWSKTPTIAPLGSGEGITHAYGKSRKAWLDTEPGQEVSDDGTFEWRTKSIIFKAPEIDQVAAISGRKGSTLMGQLRSAYSGETLGFSYADESRRIVLPEHSYRFGLSVGVQPGRATILLDDADGGTPQRFLWLPVTDKNISENPPPEPAPMRWQAPRFPPPGEWDHGFITIPIPESAIQQIRANHVTRAQGQGDALDGHSLYTRLKTAVGLAVLDERNEVNAEDWELAGVVMAVSDHTRQQIREDLLAKARIAGESKAKTDARNQYTSEKTVAEHHARRVAGKLRLKLPSSPRCAMSELRRALTSRDRVWFEDAVQVLESEGVVRRVQTESNFGSGEVLEWVSK